MWQHKILVYAYKALRATARRYLGQFDSYHSTRLLLIVPQTSRVTFGNRYFGKAATTTLEQSSSQPQDVFYISFSHLII